MIRLLYKLVSPLGAMLAGVIFKTAAREDDAPRATDAQRGWREIVLAAALQDATFAVAKAALERSGAEGTHKLTGLLAR